MGKLKVEYRNVADLNPYENNPRLNDGAVDAVAASIKEFGFKVPIVVDSDGVIVTGHMVIEGAERLPIDEKYNNPSDSHYRTESYSTCRNWQFANYFETHLKRGMGNATETIAH